MIGEWKKMRLEAARGRSLKSLVFQAKHRRYCVHNNNDLGLDYCYVFKFLCEKLENERDM